MFVGEGIAPYLIIVFGSALSGRMLPESDIDIAFLSEKKLSAYDVFMVGQELAGLLNRDVDLVDLSISSTVFQARVITTGKVIYLALRLEAMVGFRNIAVHDYQSINLVIVKKIIEEHLMDFESFAEKILLY